MIGDVVSLGVVMKGIKGATKVTKAAKTAQKAAAREAKDAVNKDVNQIIGDVIKEDYK